MSSPQGWGNAPSASEPNGIWEKPRRSSLEPFLPAAFAAGRRSFLQPSFAPQHGIRFSSEVASPSLPRKEIREKNRQGSPGALPVRHSRVVRALVFAAHLAGGHGEWRHYAWWRSSLIFTARKIGARRRNRTGLVRLTGSARRCLRLTGKLVAAPGNAPGLGADLARFRL